MHATTLEAADVPPGRLAHGYRLEGTDLVDEPALPDGAFGPMGGMLTSTRDLAAYVGFLSSAWPPRDDPDTGPVRRSSLREMQQVWRPSPATVSRDGVDGPLRLNAGGYGFGLRVWQTCGLSHTVAHSGGLPGFGSHMRWLPEHGVAIIAMGNLTYTSWGRVTEDALDALARTGGLKPRTPQPSAALLEARAAVNPPHRSLGRRRSEGPRGRQPVPGRARGRPPPAGRGDQGEIGGVPRRRRVRGGECASRYVEDEL